MSESVLLPAGSREEASAKVKQLFAATFSYAPQGVWFAPGRVNLIGEHTDYNGGLCLPIALPHATYVACARRQDRLVRIVSAQVQGVAEVDLDRVSPRTRQAIPSWATYVVGVGWALAEAGFHVSGLDIAVDSCVPFGAGLSSSAALECAVAVAWSDLNSLALAEGGRQVLVEACREAENQIAGAPTGGLDQSASLRCARGRALELDCKDMSGRQVPFELSGAGAQLLVVDTRATHELTDGQYGSRRQACERAAERLGLHYLAELTPDALPAAVKRLPAGESVRLVRHVVTEVARVRAAVRLLRSRKLDVGLAKRLGELFVASHISLRDDYQVSCPELDVAVEAALKAGAYGARMTGGGFGGSAIALVDGAKTGRVQRAIAEAFERAGFTPPRFLVALAQDAAGRIS